jgi:hypothetical protein
MPYLSPDAFADRVYALLLASAPAGLTVSQTDLLPTEPDDLPVCGVYLVEDKLQSRECEPENWATRACVVRVEIRVDGDMLTGTKAYREWAIQAVLGDSTLAGMANTVNFEAFSPYGVASDARYAGADLDFSITYRFDF